ncbi:hypothetical protein HAPAU_05070 [Halalkalicoccus paucihalophilus]|uniref:Uncharacterized protein n=1 Tax=Halalkalicoccus paucihalophilus TaxID=1008153 RepID=A0A151AJM8_9EURY|nr:hypothetical protein [Halalkalicoccus paucihalophilus]KYH27833.1 hypothetical protein HAPAU_05070 [Halalkalicoccus paucihalophilus]
MKHVTEARSIDGRVAASEYELDLVHDPRTTPVRVAIFDVDDVDRWIRANEGLLVDLTTVR